MQTLVGTGSAGGLSLHRVIEISASSAQDLHRIKWKFGRSSGALAQPSVTLSCCAGSSRPLQSQRSNPKWASGPRHNPTSPEPSQITQPSGGHERQREAVYLRGDGDSQPIFISVTSTLARAKSLLHDSGW